LLTEAGTVIAVEIDPKLASALDNRFASNPRLRTVNADILQLDPEKLFSEHGLITKPLPEYKVVANLPYYIASPILRHFLEASLKPVSMVIMVQKEVGQSIVAAPGGMSLLGISVQVYGKPEIIEYVPAQSFYPKPKVDSVIVRIEVYSKPAIDIVDISGFFGIVKAGFSSPRKQMRNSLSLGLGITASEVEEILKIAGVDSKRRPQTLTIDEWADVYRGFIGRDRL
jgi:16S rRNA (adenine1518-N6/adenine1519-N6)-dimethyltransferase